MTINDAIVVWVGRAVLVSSGAVLCAFLWWQALELLITALGVKRLMLEFYWDKLRRQKGRIVTPSASHD